ncbi:putative ribonuclease H-like domain-containing protein [Tanacetum coccineum]|uniref:Ribonuclease H-like domain-containing protein n=1 Tax=Tanacetum coccineum TaxID=301880 RepID=A0ABQ5E434_9ASTR
MLMMALPNEHLITFNQYKDAKTLFAAIQTRFGGNEATKKTQKTLLKQITNEVNTAYGVSTANTQVSLASTQVSAASTEVSTANLSDDTMSAFLASQPNRSQLLYEDLEQIHEDEIEEMDLKWQLALLSMRTRRFFQKTGRKITNNGSDTAGVATECDIPTLRIEFNKSEFNLANYKRGLASVEEQLVFYKKNEVIFYEQLAVLKRDISYKDLEISVLKGELENLKQEKESNQLKIEKVDNASKSLDKLIKSHIPDKSRKGMGFVSYNVQDKCNYHQRERVVSENNYTRVNYNYSTKKAHPSAHRNMAPRAVLMKPSLRPLNTVRLVNTGSLPKLYPILLDLKEFDGGYVTFGGGAKGGKITGKGTLKTGKLNFEDVYFVKELQFNLFSVSQMFDKMNSVLFTDTACFVLSLDFKLLDKVRFTWVFFLVSKDETSGIFKSFITKIENLVDKKVKIIRCNNGIEFKNRVMSEFCKKKGIKREFSVARTPQQNSVAERRNRTLIEAARTMLADSKLPTIFWAEAVNNACYVQNKVLVVKPYNKTPYELFRGKTLALSFMRPFGCHVTILNTLDYLGKFDGKSNEGFFDGYSLNSKAFRVYNIRTRKVEENLHIRFLENKPIITGDGPKWLFDIDVLTKSMNYVPVVAGKNSNDFNASNNEPQPSSDAGKKDDGVRKESGIDNQGRPENSTQDINTAGPSINTASINITTGSLNINTVSPIVTTARSNGSQTKPDMFSLRDNATLEATHANFFGDETEVDMSNITTTYPVPSTLNTRIHKDHSLDHVIGDVQSDVQIRRMTKTSNEQGFISAVYEGKTHKDLHTCLFACFLSQVEPKKVIQALTDSSWIKAMPDELLQFKL